MQLGWIDFSKEDRQKALDVINLLSEQEQSMNLESALFVMLLPTISFRGLLPSRPGQSIF